MLSNKGRFPPLTTCVGLSLFSSTRTGIWRRWLEGSWCWGWYWCSLVSTGRWPLSVDRWGVTSGFSQQEGWSCGVGFFSEFHWTGADLYMRRHLSDSKPAPSSVKLLWQMRTWSRKTLPLSLIHRVVVISVFLRTSLFCLKSSRDR